MFKRLFLCSDLDRTILPNGYAEESQNARPLLRQLAEHPHVTLAYVSGRDLHLMQDGIDEYQIPIPDFAICDVGTSIYHHTEKGWQKDQAWAEHISKDWGGYAREEIAELFKAHPTLELQETEKQGDFKLSFYTPEKTDHASLIAEMHEKLNSLYIKANLIWSVDEQAHCGLLDLLPRAATKLHAIEFIMQQQNFSHKETVFAGDSGNDLAVLVSGLNSVLVRNAHQDVVNEAQEVLTEKGLIDTLYLAKGNFLNMNGNYSAGVLEGVCHYLPDVKNWLTTSE